MAGATAEQQLSGFLAKYDPKIAALARAMRRRMRTLYPHAHELVYDNYNALVIGYVPSERPSEAIFSLAVMPAHVSLCFLQKAGELPDPSGSLQGSGNTARHIKMRTAAELDAPPVQALMGEAERRAKRAFDPETDPQLIIRSVSARQRPRRPKGA